MEPVQTFRIFVSSPGDTRFERARVDRVVARLNGELAGTAQLETIRWETEFYRADSTFQAQIPAAVDCNIVVAIFRARLGTELPPDFERMPDGQPYPSGTAYEVLTAIEARKTGAELPDVFVFRYSDPPLVRIDDADLESDTRSQWNRLKDFFARWFLTEAGHFKAAFQTFASTDDFEAQLERLLRDWLRQRLQRDGIVAWPIATMGSPYPGLQSFGPEHAAVFFGRTRDIARGVEAWGAGRAPFLLVVGASGSGKSSLARAGLVPRLTTPGVVPTVDVWRVASMRPGGSRAGPVAALAHALMEPAPAASDHHVARSSALPEIAQGDSQTPDDLATLLSHADATSVRPILSALARVGETERERQGYQRDVRCDLVLLVDQLDELFAATIDPAERRRFVGLLKALVDTGRVWVAATLRADLYELFLKDETLFALKEAGATLDLAPPVLSDMADAVRGPAQAADLHWEVDPVSREALDHRLIRDIDRPDLLPIVQFTLNRLFQDRAVLDGRNVLTHAAYDALGTLDGAIETAAEAAIAPLGPAASEALPRLLRALVVYTTASGAARPTPALRSAPRASVAHDEASARLVAALTDARILISGRDPTGLPVVSLAHQRVIEAWARAHDAIAASAGLLRVREEVEAARIRWDAAGRRSDLLLARGLPLSEAENAARSLAGELAPETAAFVQRSGQAARFRQRLVAAAALVFLIIAVAAGILGVIARREQLAAESATGEAREQSRQAEAARVQAEQQRQDADASRRLAEQQRRAADAAKQQAEQQLRDAQVRLATADELLDDGGKAAQLRQCLASTARVSAKPAPKASRAFFVGRWHVDHSGNSTDMEWRADGTCESRALFDQTNARDTRSSTCRWSYRPISDREFVVEVEQSGMGDDLLSRLRFTIVSRTRIRNVEHDYDAVRVVCPADEVASEREDLVALRVRADAAPDDLSLQKAVADGYQHIGLIRLEGNDRRGALDDLGTAVTIRRNLALSDPSNVGWQGDLAVAYGQVGWTHEQLELWPEALNDYERALAIFQALRRIPSYALGAARNVANTLERIATMRLRAGQARARALTEYHAAIEAWRDVVRAAPTDLELRVGMILCLYRFSLVADDAEAKLAIDAALAAVGTLGPATEGGSDPVLLREMLSKRRARLP